MPQQINYSKSLQASGYLRQKQIIPHIIPVSATTLWRWVREGSFPKPKRLSGRITAWTAESVQAWMLERNLSKK